MSSVEKEEKMGKEDVVLQNTVDIGEDGENQGIDGANLDYDEWNGVDTIVSLCMNCGENGITHLMLHKIPYFRELIIASFFCEECGERNNEVTFGGEIQPQGSKYELKVTSARDLDRQIIKSDSASITIQELEFEIPPMTQKGEISTIEGFLKNAAKNLGMYQEERIQQMPEVGAKVADIILRLLQMATGQEFPFTITIDDPAGNSFVENPTAPLKDSNLRTSSYNRTPEQDLSLGLEPNKGNFKDDKESNFKALMTKDFGSAEQEQPQFANGAGSAVFEDGEMVRLGRSEIIRIPSNCPNCQVAGDCLTAMTDIPHFKEVIIMAFDCNHCGFRNNEVKGGGAVPAMGTEITLRVESATDLKRDVLKSDSSSVNIPELELELQNGTLGGVYTTVEGLLHKIHANLIVGNPFAVGDSIVNNHSTEGVLSSTKQKFNAFMDRLLSMAKGEMIPFTLQLRDPLGNSFISAPLGSFLPPEADVNLTMSDFERSFEENEDFGLNDINTKDFETGVDHSEIILSDRLTHVVVKGPDHPHLFAKGTEDTTPGGMVFKSGSSSMDTSATTTTTKTNSSNEDSDEPLYFATPPAGWIAEKIEDHAFTIYSSSTPTPSSSSSSSSSTTDAPIFTHVREFDPEDNDLDFIQREEFGGRREGYVFRLGIQGVGYYEDKKAALISEKEEGKETATRAEDIS